MEYFIIKWGLIGNTDLDLVEIKFAFNQLDSIIVDQFLGHSYMKKYTSTFLRICISIAQVHVQYTHIITGTETTTTTLAWALLLMAHFSEVQNRVRQEIHDNIGFDRLPSTSDRLHLRYTDAVLNEVQRFATIGPNSVPHRAMINVKFRGYAIPENSMILSNIYAVQHDPNVWPDPYNFNPEANFIRRDDNGKIEIVNTDHLIPFGVGRRQCLGESLARQEIWIFFVGLMQRFQMSGNPNSTLPSIHKTTKNSLVQAPLPYELLIY